MACVGLGLTLGVAGVVYLYLARPQFWWDLAVLLIQKFGPAVVKAFLKLFARMTPAEEEEMHQAVREGRLDEWLKQRRLKRGKSYPDK